MLPPVPVAFLGDNTAIAPTAPAFDNDFWTTNNGNVFAVSPSAAGGNTYLARIPYNGTTLGVAVGFAALTRSGTASNVATSPVTEFLTASTLSRPDFIFVGGGGANHKFVNRIGSGFAGTDGTPVIMAGSFAVTGGVISGIVIDTRTAGVTGGMATANIYFGTVGILSTTMRAPLSSWHSSSRRHNSLRARRRRAIVAVLDGVQCRRGGWRCAGVSQHQ